MDGAFGALESFEQRSTLLNSRVNFITAVKLKDLEINGPQQTDSD